MWKSWMEKLTGKGKHTYRWEITHTQNMTSKPAIVRGEQMQDTGNALEIKRPAT